MGRKTAARPPRRKKSQQQPHRPPLNLVMPENLSKKAVTTTATAEDHQASSSPGLTILRTVTSGKRLFLMDVFGGDGKFVMFRNIPELMFGL